MEEFVKKCRNCKYLGVNECIIERFDKGSKYTCNNPNNVTIGTIYLDKHCEYWEIDPEYNEYLNEVEEHNLTEDEKDCVREITKVLEFINQNKLENVNFKYDQVKGLATVNGTKDGYKYNTMISFNRGGYKQDDK